MNDLATERQGFALVMVLVLVLVAGVALTVVVRRSTVAAVEARTEVEQLQRRWAITSCHAAFYGKIEQILDNAEWGRTKSTPERAPEDYQRDPRSAHRVNCRLAGVAYDLVFTDEQAGINVNRLLTDTSRGQAELAIRRLVADAPSQDAHDRAVVRLRPLMFGDDLHDERMPPVGSFGQIFEKVSPRVLVGVEGRTALGQLLTCWGDDRLNIRRAPDDVVHALCDQPLGRGLVMQLLAIRDDNPYRSLDAMMARLGGVNDTERNRITNYLTDQSSTHGLWVIAHGTQRTWYTFAVEIGSSGATGANVRYRHEFAW